VIPAQDIPPAQIASPPDAFLEDAVRFARDLVHAPQYRRLRWVLVIGALIELILAPLTSWGIDTPGFVETSSLVLSTGNPYTTGLWFNPPLAPYLDVPFMAAWNWLSGGASVVAIVPALQPAATAAGLSTYVPLPGALLAWKLPLIIANLVTALGLVLFLSHYPQVRREPEWVAGIWLLNPLVIWASAVHGEVDALAVAFVVMAFLALYREAWLMAGLLLGLAIMTKGYPLVMIPPVGAYLLFAPLPSLAGARRRVVAVGWAAAGLLAAAVIFLPDLPYLYETLASKYAPQVYGALSVEVIFNPAVTKGWGAYHAFVTNPQNALSILEIFRAFGFVAIILGTVLLAYRLSRARGAPREQGLAWLAGATAWGVVGLLLMDPAPEAENLLDLLSVMLLALPLLADRRRIRWLVAGLSLAGLVQYWAVATPVGYFPPLAVLLGPSAEAGFVNIVSAYATGGVRGGVWLGVGLFGGSMLLATWAVFGWTVIPELWRRRFMGWTRGGGRPNA
jgi:hypothetical protein